MNRTGQAFRQAAAVLEQEKAKIYERWLARLTQITPDTVEIRVAIATYTHVPVFIALLADVLGGRGLPSESEEVRSLSQFAGRQVLRDVGSLRLCLQAQRILQDELWSTVRKRICRPPDFSLDECVAVKEGIDSFMDDVLAGMMEGGVSRLGAEQQVVPGTIGGISPGIVLPTTLLPEEYFVLSSVEALAAALDAKDSSTLHHSERTARYATMIARQLGFSQEQLDELHHIALLHDVGKIGIHDSVITKPGFLTVAERDLMRLHPTIGASILSRAQILDRMVPPVLHHHEWVDGSGYPAGIKGDRIPLQSRILSVADAFDAMTSERSYRPRRPFERAMGELRAKAGTQFDPDVVDAFEGVAGEVASVCC